jgi:sn-glycerol 3-phosphate transport system permease protein
VERRVYFPGRLLPALLLTPQLAVTIVFFFWPAAQALVLSVRREDAFGLSTHFVGWGNFAAIFADPAYLASVAVSFLFSLAVLLLPYAIAPAIAGVLWLFLFNPSFGIVGSGLRRLGVDWDYLLNGRQALLLVILAAAWKQIGYNFLFFLAGLQAIPRSLLEAAALDGANSRRRFWRITFPLLAPTSFFLLVVNIVYAFFDTFGIIQNVTQGGPGQATEILVYKVWYDGVVGLDLGGSAAQSVILMAIVVALTAIQFRFVERRVHYG